MRFWRGLVVAMVGMMLTIAIAAQSFECPVIVEQALEIVTRECVNSTGRNQACYGNFNLHAEPQNETINLSFENPGDIASIADILSLNVEPMRLDEGTWGIALMRIQANIANTIPGQNVTFLMFGDVQITNANAVTSNRLDVTASASINVRAQPSTQGAIVNVLNPQEVVNAIGRNADSTWLLIEDETAQRGWVFAELVTAGGDIMLLDVLNADDEQGEAQYGPMQSVYFNTGSIGQANCNEVPPSGILVQTPDGINEVTLVMNEVVITLGSTGYLRAEAGGNLILDLIEGQARMLAQGELIIVPEGSRGIVPMDENLRPAGVPQNGLTYEDLSLDALPVALLEREFVVQPALDENEVQERLSTIIVEDSGTWEVSYGTGSAPCEARGGIQFNNTTGTITYEDGGATLTMSFGGWIASNYSGAGDGTYTASLDIAREPDADGLAYQSTVRIVGDGVISGTVSGSIIGEGYTCAIDNTFTITRQSQ